MDCPHIPELEYSEFSKRLHDKVAGQRLPISGVIELTYRCNLRCVHCYAAQGRGEIPDRQELTVGEHRQIIDQMANEGCLWLLLTGGEPLVRRNFQDIYLYAKKKGMLVTLFTNGTLLTPQIADLLAEWPPFDLQITLYGRTQATYERVTGVPGSYARCMRGLELLLERDVSFALKTMVLTLNRHELHDMEAYAESIGIEFFFDPMVHAALNQSQAPLAVRLSPQEILELDLAYPKRWESINRLYQSAMSRPIDENLYLCSAGLHSCVINPYGQLSLCMISRQPMYEVLEGSFKEGWSQAIRQERSRKTTSEDECTQCQLRLMCGRCPGWAACEWGRDDIGDPIPFLCELTHLRVDTIARVNIKTKNRLMEVNL